MDSYKDNLDTRCSSGEICKEYHRFQLRVMRMLSSLAERGVVDFSSTKSHPLKYIVSDEINSLVEMILDSHPVSTATKNDLRAPIRPVSYTHLCKKCTDSIQRNRNFINGHTCQFCSFYVSTDCIYITSKVRIF